MNIAVCIAGQMRTYQYCAKSLHENLVEPYDADVFVDTWTQNDSSSKVNKVKIDLSDITEKKLNNAYNNLVRCNIDEFKSEYHDNLNGKKMPEKIKEFEPKYYKGDLPLFYKIYSCDLMR